MPDNLKTGVVKPCRYEPIIHRSYQEMGEHFGTVIMPARIRKPRDKAKVENAVLLAERQIFDLMLTDISMPEEEGLGLIHAIRKKRPDIKIIAISGKDPETLTDAKLLGANAALRKPVTATTILQWITELSKEKEDSHAAP